MILSFADLKKYKFHYWFAFPALHSEPPWTPVGEAVDSEHDSNSITSIESSRLVAAVQTWIHGVDVCQRGFFLAKKCWNTPSEAASNRSTPEASGFSWAIATLSSYEDGFFNDSKPENCYVCFADPSNYDTAPGWMLRNLLVLVKQRWGLHKIQILRYRDTNSRPDQNRSIVINLTSSPPEAEKATESQSSHSPMPKVTGWERNPAGKLSGKVVDLTEYMDPKR